MLTNIKNFSVINITKYFRIIKSQFNKPKPFVSDVFNKEREKKVLITYLTDPFIKQIPIAHSNYLEAVEIAKVFDKLGFGVDVYQYNSPFNKKLFNNVNYDVVFGIEPNFLRAVEVFKPRKSIYYATGAYWEFQNNAENRQIEKLRKRKNIALPQVRKVIPHDSSNIANSVICIGNDWTKSTYKGHCNKIICIPVSALKYFSFQKITRQKKWGKASKNFLWFGSSGAVHKGLDLLLDIFPKHPELHLYICGRVQIETRFLKIYKNELFNTPNIHYVGWIVPNSSKYLSIVTKCAFTILPSCSEGMSSSIATNMMSGLIPVTTRETGINIKNRYGFIIEDFKLSSVEKLLIRTKQISEKQLKELSYEAYKHATMNFSINNFRKKFTLALQKNI